MATTTHMVNARSFFTNKVITHTGSGKKYKFNQDGIDCCMEMAAPLGDTIALADAEDIAKAILFEFRSEVTTYIG